MPVVIKQIVFNECRYTFSVAKADTIAQAISLIVVDIIMMNPMLVSVFQINRRVAPTAYFTVVHFKKVVFSRNTH